MNFLLLGWYQELSSCLLGEGICLPALLDEEKANINRRRSQSSSLQGSHFAKSCCSSCSVVAAAGSASGVSAPGGIPLELQPINTNMDEEHLLAVGLNQVRLLKQRDGWAEVLYFCGGKNKWQRKWKRNEHPASF